MSTDLNAKFEKMTDLEFIGGMLKRTAGFNPVNVSLYAKSLQSDGKIEQAQLFAMLDSLTPEEMKAYGEYRKRYL